MPYIIHVFHLHYCNFIHFLKTATLDMAPLNDLPEMVKIAAATFVNIPFSLHEQAEFNGGMKRSFNDDIYGIVIPSKTSKSKSAKYNGGVNAGNASTLSSASVGPSALAAVNSVHSVKAPKPAVNATATAVNAHQRTGV